MSRLARSVAVPFFCLLASGHVVASCTSTSCTAYAASDFVVTVVNAAGTRVCDAVVTVRDGSFAARLTPFDPSPASCTYNGTYERKGTYTIEVVSGTKRTTRKDVVVSGDACHVRTRHMTLRLPA